MFEEDRDFDAEIEEDLYDDQDGYVDDDEMLCAFCGCPLADDEEASGVCAFCR